MKELCFSLLGCRLQTGQLIRSKALWAIFGNGSGQWWESEAGIAPICHENPSQSFTSFGTHPETNWHQDFGKNGDIFFRTWKMSIRFGLEEPDKILASFFVSESPFESFSKFVKTTPGPQSWCLYTETHRNKSQQHFSRIFTSTNLSPI